LAESMERDLSRARLRRAGAQWEGIRKEKGVIGEELQPAAGVGGLRAAGHRAGSEKDQGKGFPHLPLLRHALQVELNCVSNYDEKSA